MALATRPKKTARYRKTQAGHHRQTKHYIKPYWPYLPVFAILGAGAWLSHSWQAGNDGLTAVGSGASLQASRLNSLTGNHSAWLGSALLVAAVLALAFFLARSSLHFHRVVVRSERFINNHPFLEIAAVAVFTAGFVLAG